MSRGRHNPQAEKRTHNIDRTAPRKQNTYTDAQRLAAVTVLKANGGMTVEGIAAARAILGVKVATSALQSWIVKYGPQVDTLLPATRPADPAAVVAETQETLQDLFATIIRKTAQRATSDAVINNAALRDLMVAGGIAADKMIKLAGIDPAVMTVLYEIIDGCRDRGIDSLSALQSFRDAILQKPTILIDTEKPEPIRVQRLR